MYSKIKKIGAMLVLLFCTVSVVTAQDAETDYQGRTSVELVYKPIKKLKLKLIPEVRFDEEFTVGKYLIETQAAYKPLSFLTVSAAYRYTNNPREKKGTEILHQYAFSAGVSQEFNRFEAGLKLKYTNYGSDEKTDIQFLRYQASLDYNIPKSKITPAISVEAFQELDAGKLYKMRYGAGLEYKLFKKNYIELNYKFDYYMQESINKHILGLNYKIVF